MISSDIGRVKVGVTQLQKAGEDAASKIERYRSSIQTINSLMEKSASYWKGEAADAYRGVFRKEYDRAMTVLDDFMTIPKSLFEYAGIYSEVNASTTNMASNISEFSME